MVTRDYFDFSSKKLEVLWKMTNITKTRNDQKKKIDDVTEELNLF